MLGGSSPNTKNRKSRPPETSSYTRCSHITPHRDVSMVVNGYSLMVRKGDHKQLSNSLSRVLVHFCIL